MEQGNHSWDHKTLTHLTPEQIAAEISRTSDVIRSVTGANPTLFRPPGGGYNNTVMANSQNLPMILWSIDTLDWSHKNAQTSYDIVMSSVKDGDIILMHDIYQSTSDAVVIILERLAAEGYEVVSVSELLGDKLTAGKKYSLG